MSDFLTDQDKGHNSNKPHIRFYMSKSFVNTDKLISRSEFDKLPKHHPELGLDWDIFNKRQTQSHENTEDTLKDQKFLIFINKIEVLDYKDFIEKMGGIESTEGFSGWIGGSDLIWPKDILKYEG